MKSKYLNKVASLVDGSSWHALPNIVRTDHALIRIIWLVCFCLAFAYCAYITVVNVLDYFAFNVLERIEMVDDYEAEFPAVTICNVNSIDFSIENNRKVFDKYFQEELELSGNYLSQQISGQPVTPAFCKKGVADAIRRIPNFNSYGYSPEKMLVSCVFDNKACSINDFQILNDTLFGTCMRFNSGRNRSGHDVPVQLNKRPDMNNGFRVELYVGAPEYHPCWSSVAGAIVVVHNKTVRPLYSQDGMKVPPGLETTLMVKKVIIEKLESPYSDCIREVTSKEAFNSSFYRETVLKDGIYSQKWCLHDCAFAYVSMENAILCVNLTNKTSPSLTECLGNRANFGNYMKKCLPECPGVCDTYSFELTTASALYPALAYSQYHVNRSSMRGKFPYENPTYEQLSRSVLAINIFFPVLNRLLITEIPAINIGTLLANLGGQLGLFLGCSLLSFVEIVEIFLELCFLAFDRRIVASKSQGVQ